MQVSKSQHFPLSQKGPELNIELIARVTITKKRMSIDSDSFVQGPLEAISNYFIE